MKWQDEEYRNTKFKEENPIYNKENDRVIIISNRNTDKGLPKMYRDMYGEMFLEEKNTKNDEPRCMVVNTTRYKGK